MSATEVTAVGVVGAGTMGAGIAQIAGLGGYETRLYDALPGAAEKGIARLGEALDKGAARGRWSEGEATTARGQVGAAASLSDLGGCELVIEAAPERLDLKRELFTSVAAVVGPEAVLATNTSSLRVADIAIDVPRPERLIGMHFFNPPALMKLVEIVATPAADDAALAVATAVGERMGRTPIRAKDSPGFVANRLSRPFFLESLRMLGAGVADAATIDRTIRLQGGFRMGPFQLIDLIGLDVNLEIARSFYRQGGEPARWRPSPVQEQLVAEGRFGRKSGRGYYSYGDGAEATDADAGPTDAAILRRLYAQIANEAALALEEEVASPADMDTAMRLGFNWPKGSLELAEEIGAGPAVELLEELERSEGPAYAPAPLLRRAAERGLPLREA